MKKLFLTPKVVDAMMAVQILFTRVAILLLFFASTVEATIRYADNATQGLCANGAITYNPKTRRCDDGGSDLVYTGIQAVQNAANVANRGGDTIYIRGWNGVYQGTSANGLGMVTLRQGSSDTNRNIYEGYQNEFPSVRGFGCDFGACDTDYASQLLECRDYDTGQPAPCNQPVYVTIRNLKVDGEHIVNGAIGNVGHIILENLEVTNSHEHGIIGIDYAQLINLYVHHNGDLPESPIGGEHCNGLQCHNLYGGPNLLIDGGRYSFARMGIGIQCYPHCANSIIRNVRLDHNESYGLIICDDCQNGRTGTLTQVYNVISDHNVKGPGFNLDTGVPIVAYNLLSYSNGGGGICTNANGIVVRNSISNQGIGFCSGPPGFIFTGFTGSSNITTGVSALFVDPDNANPDLQNFHLLASASPAIGQGADLSSVFPSPPRDFGNGTGYASGTTRTVPWDIGPYVFGVGPPPGDTQAPILAVTLPFNGAYTTKTSMLFSGTATDNVEVTSVTFVCTSGSGSASYAPSSSTWTRTQSLNLGANTCTFTGNDLAGNTGPTAIGSVTVTRVAAPTPGLVAAYSFDAGSGPTATDTSGNGNTGTLNGGVTWTTSGASSNALHFDGAPTSFVSIPDSTSLHLIDNWTMSAKVRVTTVTGNWQSIISKFNHVYYLYATSQAPYCPSGNGAPFGGFQSNAVSFHEFSVCGTPVTPGQYFYLSTTHDGDTMKFYIDAQLVGSTTILGGTGPSTGPLLIGHDDNSGSNPGFAGDIDDVRIYNRALTQPEILTDMNTPVIPPPNTVTIKLNVSSWKFGPGVTAKFGLQ